MKLKYGVIAIIVMLSFFYGSTVWSQSPAAFRQGEVGMPYFSANVYSVYSSENGEPLARVYVQIVNDNLTFVKADSGFSAEVQIDVYMTENDREFVFNRTFIRKILVDDYSKTNSGDLINTFSTDIPVDPGKYSVGITVLDENSNKQYNQSNNFELSEIEGSNKRFALSDVVFFSEFVTDDSGKIVAFDPALTSTFSTEGKYIYAYFSTYIYDAADSLFIKYLIKDDRGIVIQQNQYQTSGQQAYREHFIRLNRYYFNRNKYSMELSAHIGQQWLIKSSSFAFSWKFTPNSQQDLDLAIKQLRYIADEDSIKYYRDSNYDEKKGFFKRFWLRKDPNPSTKYNELMEEYYRRVNFANNNFSATGIGGWLTDRGRIYIKFGEPDDIERHPFEAETYPYVIWRYYSLQKNFLFIDRTGFGDFELHPSYYYVEYE